MCSAEILTSKGGGVRVDVIREEGGEGSVIESDWRGRKGEESFNNKGLVVKQHLFVIDTVRQTEGPCKKNNEVEKKRRECKVERKPVWSVG